MLNERLEGGLVNFFTFVDVDRAETTSLPLSVRQQWE
jgi:hypothetical protein